MGFFSKISNGLRNTRKSFMGALSNMLGAFTRIDDDLFESLEEILVMADVGVYTASDICDKLREQVKQNRVTDPAEIKNMLKSIICEMISGDEQLNISAKPSVIMVIGVNGAGKTTTIGKMSAQFKAQGKSVIVGAADTFRAAAIDQLAVWADRADVPIIKHDEGSDPASVVYDTIAAGKSKGSDIIICDTAGRLHNKKNLMDELAKMARIISRELPESSVETLLVLDATTGQNAVNQAREFSKAANITGIVLTKLDGTAKGGVVIAIRNELSLPVKFIGVGEGIDDLQPFNAEQFVDGLFEE